MEQIAKVLSAKSAKSKKGKRKVSFLSKIDSEESNNSNSESDDYFGIHELENHNFAIRDTIAKNTKNKMNQGNQSMTEIVIEIQGTKTETKPLRCLLDTGTTKSMILGTHLPLNTKIIKSPS